MLQNTTETTKGVCGILSNSPLDAEGLIEGVAKRYCKSIEIRKPNIPVTTSDLAINEILEVYFRIEITAVNEVLYHHKLSMAAENIIGHLLELFLHETLKPHGWIWCPGSLIRKIDFIKPINASQNDYFRLQVKNRDNSENSSSKAVREGTSILHWFRTFSHKATTNWAAFPDTEARAFLSEEKFLAFTRQYCEELRTAK